MKRSEEWKGSWRWRNSQALWKRNWFVVIQWEFIAMNHIHPYIHQPHTVPASSKGLLALMVLCVCVCGGKWEFNWNINETWIRNKTNEWENWRTTTAKTHNGNLHNNNNSNINSNEKESTERGRARAKEREKKARKTSWTNGKGNETQRLCTASECWIRGYCRRHLNRMQISN